MRPRVDLTGNRYGLLTVVRFSGRREGGKYIYSWLCSCDCGVEVTVLSSHLRGGVAASCGCKRRSRGGASSNPLYKVWANMIRRCTDPEDKSFKDYGGRGIRVSARWTKLEAFIEDMGDRPKGCTLERVNNDGPYSKENCVWADRRTQANNKRNIPLRPWGAVRKSVAQWARDYGMPAETLRSRLKAGRSLIEAIPQISA